MVKTQQSSGGGHEGSTNIREFPGNHQLSNGPRRGTQPRVLCSLASIVTALNFSAPQRPVGPPMSVRRRRSVQQPRAGCVRHRTKILANRPAQNHQCSSKNPHEYIDIATIQESKAVQQFVTIVVSGDQFDVHLGSPDISPLSRSISSTPVSFQDRVCYGLCTRLRDSWRVGGTGLVRLNSSSWSDISTARYRT